MSITATLTYPDDVPVFDGTQIFGKPSSFTVTQLGPDPPATAAAIDTFLGRTVGTTVYGGGSGRLWGLNGAARGLIACRGRGVRRDVSRIRRHHGDARPANGADVPVQITPTCRTATSRRLTSSRRLAARSRSVAASTRSLTASYSGRLTDRDSPDAAADVSLARGRREPHPAQSDGRARERRRPFAIVAGRCKFAAARPGL